MAETEIKLLRSLRGIAAADWNALVESGNPFMRYEFLWSLESTQCTGQETSWQPMHAVLFRDGRLAAAIPAYRRSDSYGEYIFDWSWANAYEQSGLAYYPKITVAAPFTPASGRRLLGANADDLRILVLALEKEVAGRASGIHFLCTTRDEQKILSQAGYAPRLTHQYHWQNRNFASFDEYLDGLRAHRRKEIKRERRKCLENNLEIVTLSGPEITEQHMRAMFTFYIQTYSRKWGSPYLNLDCFLRLGESMRSQLVLVMARRSDTWVAGAMAFRQDERLFGRYWGALAHYPFLHFELCLYRLIEFAIREGISLFEAGAQGEHKFQRGFSALPVYSSHKLFHGQAAESIGAHLSNERRATLRLLRAYRSASPNKREIEYIPEFDAENPGAVNAI